MSGPCKHLATSCKNREKGKICTFMTARKRARYIFNLYYTSTAPRVRDQTAEVQDGLGKKALKKATSIKKWTFLLEWRSL